MNTHTPAQRIDSKAVKAWRISGSLYTLPFIIAFIPLYIFVEDIAAVPFIELYAAGFVFMFLLLVFPLAKIRWQRWHYEINEQEIDLLRGIIVKKRTLIPMNRIQHVDNKQGPIYKTFGLSSVSVSTAATTHEIPALDDTTAEQVRHNISTFVTQAKEDV